MDQLEPIGVLVAAVLGSAGVSGAVTGAVQFSRAARAARMVEHIKKALEGADTGSGAEALRLALDRERVRLAAISFIGVPQVVVPFLLLMVGSVLFMALVTFRIFPNEAGTSSAVLGLITTSGVAVLTFVIGLDTALQRRRTRFMAEVSTSGADVTALTSEIVDLELRRSSRGATARRKESG